MLQEVLMGHYCDHVTIESFMYLLLDSLSSVDDGSRGLIVVRIIRHEQVHDNTSIVSLGAI